MWNVWLENALLMLAERNPHGYGDILMQSQISQDEDTMIIPWIYCQLVSEKKEEQP